MQESIYFSEVLYRLFALRDSREKETRVAREKRKSGHYNFKLICCDKSKVVKLEQKGAIKLKCGLVLLMIFLFLLRNIVKIYSQFRL